MRLIDELTVQALKNASLFVSECVNEHDDKLRVTIGGSWKVFPDEVDDLIRSVTDLRHLKWSYSGSDPHLKTKFCVYRERPD